MIPRLRPFGMSILLFVCLCPARAQEYGPTLLKDIYPGVSSSAPTYLTDVNGTLFFIADDGTYGVEVWKSDGTAAGTAMVKDINPGAGGSFPFDFTNVNGTLFFTATDGTRRQRSATVCPLKAG